MQLKSNEDIKNALISAFEAKNENNLVEYNQINGDVIAFCQHDLGELSKLLEHYRAINDHSHYFQSLYKLSLIDDNPEILLAIALQGFPFVAIYANELTERLLKITLTDQQKLDIAFTLTDISEFNCARQILESILDLRLENDAPNILLRALNLLLQNAIHQKDIARAESYLTRALHLAPTNIIFNFNAGLLEEEKGNKEAAITRFEHCLTLDDAFSPALCRLLELKPSDKKLTGYIAHGQKLLNKLQGDEVTSMLFSLGNACDELKQYENAFGYFKSANSRLNYQYNTQHFKNLLDEITKNKPTVKTSRTESPIFICGMFRSGSTLVEQILSSHSEVTNAGEVDFFTRHINLENNLSAYQEIIHNEDSLTLLAQKYCDYFSEQFDGASHITNKHLHNYLYIDLIIAMFPNARIVFTKRAKKNNILSLYFNHLAPNVSYSNSLTNITHQYDIHEQLVSIFKTRYPKNIIEVDYESLVTEFDSTARNLVSFLGLDYEDAMARFYSNKNLVSTASVWQVRKPIYKSSLDRFAHYESMMEI